MNSKIENFLLDSKLNDEVFEGSLNKLKCHKEKYDDRFEIIYIKKHSESLKQERYDIGGYYDTKDHVIYEPDRWLFEKIPEDSVIKIGDFNKLGQKFMTELKDYLREYCFENEEKLIQLGHEKYDAKDDYRFISYKKEVRKTFLSDREPKITLSLPISDYDISRKSNYYDMLISYLNNSNEAIENFSQELIESKGKEFGLELLIYYDKIDYLEEIKVNKDNFFNEIYINKNILEAIKYVPANTLNITIKYGDNECTFKYDYDNLKRDLLDGNTSNSNLYSSGYEKVSDFIRENSSENNLNRYDRKTFSFSNITSISHGKVELYSKQTMEKEAEIEEEEEREI